MSGKSKERQKISIVIPVYQEAPSIPSFLEEVRKILSEVDFDYELIFAIDPSPDNTESVICSESETDTRVKALIFSRRIGQPAATLAGIEWASGDAVIVMDVDFQDPPNLLPLMLERWQNGYDVVIPQRRSRSGEPWLKTIIARAGHWVIEMIADVEIPADTGDFRLMSRRVVDSVNALPEAHGFLRGLTAVVGFTQTTVKFDRPPRKIGRGNYNRFLGSLKIGLNGVVGFSSIPLRAAMILGFAVVSFGFVISVISFFIKIVGFDLPIDSPLIVTLMLLFSGVQLICIGIVGEYIGRIYDEVKRRPKYIIQQTIGF